MPEADSIIVTTWLLDGGRLELTDTIAWPDEGRPPEQQESWPR